MLLASLTSTLLAVSSPAPVACEYGDDSPCGAILDALMLLWTSDACAGSGYYPTSVSERTTGFVSIGSCAIPTIPEFDELALFRAWVNLTAD